MPNLNLVSDMSFGPMGHHENAEKNLNFKKKKLWMALI